MKLDTEAVTKIAAAQGINTVSELCRRCGSWDRSYFGKVVSGKRAAQPKLVHDLARALHRKPSDLLETTESEFGRLMDAEFAAEPEVVS